MKPNRSGPFFLKARELVFTKKMIFLILLMGFVLGNWSGYQSYQYLAKKGCYPLSSEVISLNLAPSSEGTVRFIALGDVGTANADQKEVSEGVRQVCESEGCDFVLLLGDNFMENGITSVHDPLIEKAFEGMYAAIDLPFIPVLGNHDVRRNVSAQVHYSLLNAKWNMPNYTYQFEVGPARFFALNTNCNLFGWLPLKDQLADDPAKWTFVFGHHPVYSGGVHGDNEWQVRWYWQNFLQERVHFYLSGHNHHLEHLQMPEDPTEYIVSGAGGSHYRSPQDRDRSKPSQAKSRFVYQDTGFAWMEVSENQVEVKFFDAQGEAIYQFSKERPP